MHSIAKQLTTPALLSEPAIWKQPEKKLDFGSTKHIYYCNITQLVIFKV